MDANEALGSASSSLEVLEPHPSAARRRRKPWVYLAAGVLIASAALAAFIHETRTSALQAYVLPRYTARVTYEVADGPSPRIAFPRSAPFDDRLGYSRMADFQARVAARGFTVRRQAVASPELVRLVDLGIAPPFREPLVTGLTIRGMDGAPLYDATRTGRWFRSFEEVPPLLVASLLYIENRELLAPFDPRANPAIEWDRLAKASLFYTGSKLGLSLPVHGGSTLAIQLEKYRHSPHGRTDSPLDKLRQVAGASLKAYRAGADTRDGRREIVVDYLNTAPLAAAPGYGEIYGLGDGLYAWFGIDLAAARAALAEPGHGPEQASAYKHMLALLIALRAPTYYLQKDHLALNQRINEYTRLLAADGILDRAFAEQVMAAPLQFLQRAPVAPPLPYARQKSTNAIRTTLLQWLDLPSFYELDRLHLEADSTIDMALQADVERLFTNLADKQFVRANGLTGEQLLRNADPAQVVYSLMLFERTPWGNLLRVNADNLDRPFDINGGVKLDLGSTAKLRTLAHYLEVVGLLREELAGRSPSDLKAFAKAPRTDPLTAWAAEQLAENPSIALDALLQHALDRKYSAGAGETFFTGGGRHVFSNFTKVTSPQMRVRDGMRMSTNLVFIRMMRDLMRYHRARITGYDAEAVLAEPLNPDAERLLAKQGDEEARMILSRAYRRYSGLTADAAIAKLLGSRASSARHLTILFYAWHGGTPAQLAHWLRGFGVEQTPEEVQRLVRAYGLRPLTLLDHAYLLGRHPLELWAVGQLAQEPGTSWTALLERSAPVRGQVMQWLFRPRSRGAQHTRLRIATERDAFERMTPYWQRFGFPFDHLVPSLATAIGSSADRPAALADLMGIIVNDGVRLPMLRVTRLNWAAGTPYETELVPRTDLGVQVMQPEVARALRGVLADVVTAGTAARLAGAFKGAGGKAVSAGGKTGSGDNRFKTFGRGGWVKSERVVSRTATFTFYVGDRYFGVLTAFVPGKEAGHYEFTSKLSVTVLRLLAPAINARLAAPGAPAQPPLPGGVIVKTAPPVAAPRQRTGG
ncbi:MAG: transglycosylase domain-containing protein [Candidatus Binatia bacterium]